MVTHEQRPELEVLRYELQGPLSTALAVGHGPYTIELLCEPKNVADDPAKLLVTDRGSRKLAVVLVASPVDPNLVRRGMRFAAEAKGILGERLGSVILEPLGEGNLGGLSYTILPYHRPFGEGLLARRYWRLALRRKVMDWLANVTEATVTEASYMEVEKSFERPVAHVATLEIMDESIRRAADEALGRLKSGEWKPKFVLMHGDLWFGNMLRAAKWLGATDQRRGFPFVIIDWPGGLLRGYAMYDLVRLAASMRLRTPGFGREVLRHCEILGGEPALAMDYLIASLGHLGLNLGEFPAERYCESSMACFTKLRTALG
jgi:hypothetical protein